MGWRASTAGVLLLALCACGGSGPCTGNPAVRLRSVPDLQEQGRLWGTTIWTCDRPTQIQISQTAPPELLERVVAHEFLHAAGLIEHEANPNCYLYEIIVGGPPVPCAEEVARLRTVAGSFTVMVESPELMDEAVAAAELWNDEAGRTMFEVVLAP